MEKTIEQHWKELCEEYSTEDMCRWFGDLNTFKGYAEDGGLQIIFDWLNTPEPDWQRDC